MTEVRRDDEMSPEFANLLRELSAVRHRSDIVLERIDAPSHIAPEAVAFAVEVDAKSTFVHSRASARFVLLHNPEPPEGWGSTLRVISYLKAPLEADLGLDPFVAGVVWSWLEDGLHQQHARYHSISGTVTKTINSGFGALSTETDGTEIELRASWSAEVGQPVTPHLLAWIDLISEAASLPPVPGEISVLLPTLTDTHS
ncbi:MULTISPECIES: DUF3000 family protein [unclassified Pseudoclavibacter]|uniref:DUF3000 family protein n=1 Tax=unclassified Pseudoclavibacter TaxID=2615177 RepID=UPI0013016F91|nr:MULTISPECIES: DUF3000 family protein [unclassified Pseudoclavibacter]KAB1658347.1 DUF3000 family protein [Pseudoclavibacter sp. CFCC 11306]KAB1661743.1 DUF3000 family protein [Pseudoclavibacter sp. CFCC 13796]